MRLGALDLCILDTSWHMPAEKSDAKEEYAREHIPGASFFDIDRICDLESPFPHMLPSAREFSLAVGALGIDNDSAVVVYDTSGIFSAARVWWMFRVFGHNNVKVLDGGLPKWKAEARPLESDIPHPAHTSFIPHFRPELVRTKAQVQANVKSGRELLIDARSPGRFTGTEPEPRPGLLGGHIPGSINVFFKDCLDNPYNTLKNNGDLAKLFDSRGVSPKLPIAATCGSGVTACIPALALYELGNDSVAIYDGAWAEWGLSSS